MEEFRPGTIAAPADAIKPAPTRGERERAREASGSGAGAAARAAAFLLLRLRLNGGGGVFGFLCLVVAHWCVRTALEERKGKRERARERENQVSAQYVFFSKSLLGIGPNSALLISALG